METKDPEAVQKLSGKDKGFTYNLESLSPLWDLRYEETVRRRGSAYMEKLNIMHPFITQVDLENLFEAFFRQTIWETHMEENNVTTAGYVFYAFGKQNGVNSSVQMERTLSTANFLLICALGKICEQKDNTLRRLKALEQAERPDGPRTTAASATPTIRGIGRIREPALYYGKSSHELKAFIAQCQSAFRWQPEQFNTEYVKVTWAAQFLEADPAREFNTFCDRSGTTNGGPPETFTFGSFHTFLKNLHTDPENRRRIAALHYTNAKQRPNQTVRKFAAYLDELEQEMDPYTESQRVDNLLTRLLPNVRQQLINGGNASTLGWTRETLINTVTMLETNAATTYVRNPLESHRRNADGERNHGYGKATHRSGGFRNRRSGARQHENTPTETLNSVKGGHRMTPYDRSNRNLTTTRGEMTNKPNNVTCFNCNKPGHYSRECRIPKSNEGPTVRRMEARASAPAELKREERN